MASKHEDPEGTELVSISRNDSDATKVVYSRVSEGRSNIRAIQPSDELALPSLKQKDFLIASDVSKDNALQAHLVNIGLKQAEIEFIIEQGERYIEKPVAVLAAKIKISKENATLAIEALKSFRQQQQQSHISNHETKLIEACLKENPEVDNPEDIADICELSVATVYAYFDSLPLNESQKAIIKERMNAGNPINDIVSILKLPETKVRDYIERTFITFSGAEGQKTLGIIREQIPGIECSKLREMIISRDLKLLDKLYFISKEREYNRLRSYFGRFEESNLFFDINVSLTLEDIKLIKGKSFEDIEQLSKQLNKVETIIKRHLEQYQQNPVETEHYTNLQINKIRKINNIFGMGKIPFQMYRMIISNSFEDLVHCIEQKEQAPRNILEGIFPLAFYYLKCSLPLDDITQIIANTSNVSLTTHDLFHILFQLSEPVLKGYCIEHYSFSNPVPLYYPKLSNSFNTNEHRKLHICKELWYSLQEYNGLISFGIGRASWNPIGKSYLLDFIFGTDFVRGNPQASAFHLNSIDIQMTRNLFGEITDIESTKWAYIDCHGYSNLTVIEGICEHLDIALIHISHVDFVKHPTRWHENLNFLTKSIRYVFLFIRDYKKSDVLIQVGDNPNQLFKFIFVPDLTKSATNIHSVKKKLKEIGYEILHLKYDNPKFIGELFLEKLIAKIHPDPDSIKDIQSDKRLIQQITSCIERLSRGSNILDFSFLKHYPTFVDLMSCFYKAALETDQKRIDEWNDKHRQLDDQLNNTEMGEIVVKFNEIISKRNSSLILWKLAQHLSILSKQMTKITDQDVEHKNDKYTLEIMWREALLSSKSRIVRRKSYNEFFIQFASNFSKHVGRGEPFELIDGDNLRFFNHDINALLSQLYDNQREDLMQANKGQSVKMKQAPIVVSIFGPQSSGKSTLLNYCFGCKFLTSSGRCTRGIYGSLSRLSRPVNRSNNFLILDTEGLDAIERGNIKDTAHLHFDRTMVLFCLAVSQVVIINVRGDIGCELQNLLQMCAYSLNKLKVRKVSAPKIFFVLNQQADPDPAKHLDSINILMKKLNEESELIETEGVKFSQLIQVSKENLFILPSAFNSEQMNKNLFSSKVIKLTPTTAFADKCADLRMSIINQLDEMPVQDRAPFETMSEWMDMSGTIWDTIIKYQDIVKYGNVEEVKGSNMLRGLVSELICKHFYSMKQRFLDLSQQLLQEINAINTLIHQNTILIHTMDKFDEVFNPYQDRCLAEFDDKCQSDTLLKKMIHICSDSRLNLSRLIYMERKSYENKFKIQIKAISTEIQLSESMKRFQEKIIKNVDNYLELSLNEQKKLFESAWIECFGDVDISEKKTKQGENETFDNLYSIFRMESKIMEKKSDIFEIFRSHDFLMSKVIPAIESDILGNFKSDPTTFRRRNHFIYKSETHNIPIRDMTTYAGTDCYHYFGKNSLYFVEKRLALLNKEKLQISDWVPKNCRPLVKYCSGYYNHPEITWKELDHNTQVLMLASKLKAPHDSLLSTWEKLVCDISTSTETFVMNDPNISLATVKLMINFLYDTLKLVNYEISFIDAKLSNMAERRLSTLVFAYALRSLLKKKLHKEYETSIRKKNKKQTLFQYFLQKIENRKMVRGSWNREKMKESDKRTAENFALEFAASIERGLKSAQQPIIDNLVLERKGILSHEHLLLTANHQITNELSKDPGREILDENNFVIQYICKRNEVLMKLFKEKWLQIESELYDVTVGNLESKYKMEIVTMIRVIKELMNGLEEKCVLRNSDNKDFDSYSNFELVMGTRGKSCELSIEARECPFKAMVIFLRKYFDPKVSSEDFEVFFSHTFEIDGVQVKTTDNYVLCNKPMNQSYALSEDLFKKLENTKMFNSENIFNLFDYITNFLSTLDTYKYKLPEDEFEAMVHHLKEEFEKNALGCPSQCPSCGKLCERELHPNEGQCQIKTGHQICSMSGKVWNNDDKRTAVLFKCDDYDDDTNFRSKLSDSMKWGKFKEICGINWDWTLPTDEHYVKLQQDNSKKMQAIWNKFGKGILNYYAKNYARAIAYVPYTSFQDVTASLTSNGCYICFVIDGTGSMLREIKKTCISVGQLISKYKGIATETHFKVVVYRDHCDDKILEIFPVERSFTSDYTSIQSFLEKVKACGGGDYPEAVLDGLATAATQCDWESSLGTRKIIIHIFDAPPHGDFPDYKSHHSKSNKKHCCCCNQGTKCRFDWQRDVWDNMKRLNINYFGINTGVNFPKFEATMKDKLGYLCGEFQIVGKEVVNEAILQIFIDN